MEVTDQLDRCQVANEKLQASPSTHPPTHPPSSYPPTHSLTLLLPTFPKQQELADELGALHATQVRV